MQNKSHDTKREMPWFLVDTLCLVYPHSVWNEGVTLHVITFLLRKLLTDKSNNKHNERRNKILNRVSDYKSVEWKRSEHTVISARIHDGVNGKTQH